MRWLFLMLVATSVVCAETPSVITSATYQSNQFTLNWTDAVAGDPDVVRVFDVERISSLAADQWTAVASNDYTGDFTDEAPPPERGFYRLKASAFPFAMIGPEAQSWPQGLSFSSPGFQDVIFFRSLGASNSGSNSTAIWVDGVLRGSVAYSSSREGEQFLYGTKGGPPIGTGTLNNDAVLLTTPGFAARPFAEVGAAAARASIVNLVTRFPDSVTVWQNIGGAHTNEATVLYLRASAADTNKGARPAEFAPDIVFLGQPLVSGGAMMPIASLSDALPFSSPDPQMVNLNATNISVPVAFVGTRSMTNPGAPITAAEWIYIGANMGPTNATNPPVARYAYWVEDESFKVNVNTATNGPRGTSTNAGPGDVRLDGSWRSSSNAAVQATDAAEVVSARGTNQNFFPTISSAAVVAGLTDVTSTDDFRFLTTVNSAGLDLSRGGFKRFNLNSVTNGVTTGALKRAALDRLTVAITNTNAAPLFGQRFYRLTNDLVGVNDTSAVTRHHASIYLQKIAANIYDYLDDDNQPTVISNNASFSLVTGRPTFGIGPLGGGLDGSNSIVAMGVENVPRLQEYAIHMRVRSIKWDSSNPDSFGFVFNTNAGATNPFIASYEIWLDHYFEFWNPGTRDFTHSPDTFLKIFDQPAWGPGAGGGAVTGNSGRSSGSFVTNNRTSSEIPLIDALTGSPVVFPAGQVTVLTTAPLTALNTGANPADVLVVPDSSLVPLRNVPTSDRVFTGTTSSIRTANYSYQPAAAAFGGGPDFGYNRLFEVAMQYGRPGGTVSADYASGVLIGNNQGIIESHVGLPIGPIGGLSRFSAIVESSWIRNNLSHVGGNIPNGQSDYILGGSLRGNANNGVPTATTKPNAAEGDPRSLLEQLEFKNYSSGTSAHQTRFYNTLGGGVTPVFVNSTFGRPNTNYVSAASWTDASNLNAGPSNAPLVVRNGPMQSIGELGHITDPARPYYTAGVIPVLARGGGRTLRVGQSELTNFGGTNIGWYDGKQTNASRTWTSWRLADIFTTAAASNVAIQGLINPNGALRDNGAALRAALFGLTFMPAGPDGAATIAGRAANVTIVVANVLGRLTSGSATGFSNALNPFWERGEISELDVFNSGVTLAPGAAMSNAIDRGREELVRRSIEMITTRGSIFTVYALGQSLHVTATATNVLGTARLKSTFEMTPQFVTPAVTNDFFNPGSVAEVSQRFSSPTNYATTIISSEFE